MSSGRRPNPKAAVSAMPVVSVKAKARITAVFMASPLFSDVFSGLAAAGRQTDDSNRRKISDEKRCHRYLQHYSPAQFGTVLQEQEKSCALCHNRDWEVELFPAPQWPRATPHPTANANLYVEVPLIPTAGPRPTLSVLRSRYSEMRGLRAQRVLRSARPQTRGLL